MLLGISLYDLVMIAVAILYGFFITTKKMNTYYYSNPTIEVV